MNTLPAQELKRRGIAALDDIIVKGDVHLTRNNKPQYVVVSEGRYRELVNEANEAYLARIQLALEEVKSGKVKQFTTAQDLLDAIDVDEPV